MTRCHDESPKDPLKKKSFNECLKGIISINLVGDSPCLVHRKKRKEKKLLYFLFLFSLRKP